MEGSRSTNIIITILSIALIAAIGVLIWLLLADDVNIGNQEENKKTATISSFQECVEAGFPVMESHPRQCKTEDGRTFVEEINQDPDSSSEQGVYTSLKGVEIHLDTPQENDTVSSPLTIRGEVPGNWSFEADFPVVLTDWDGRIIAEGVASLQGDWMTEELVPFEAELTFNKPEAPSSTENTGSLILQKDNPSGLSENDDAVEITVRFE